MEKITIRVTKLLAFALLLLQNVSGGSERSFSTSVVTMKFLLEKEHQLLTEMENYANKLENKLSVIRSAITQMRTANLKSKTNPEECLSNPINSYALIRRLHEDWPKWEQFLRSSLGADEIYRIQKLLTDMPTRVDLMEASEAIFRLNAIYGINPAEMAVGFINGKKYDSRFSAIDCYSIADHMFQSKRYFFSEHWAFISLQLFRNSDMNAVLGLDKVKILELYAKALLKQDYFDHALETINIALRLSPHKTSLLQIKSKIELKDNALTETEPKEGYEILPFEDNKEIDRLRSNCQQYTYTHQTNLHCLYNKTTSAFLQLAPLKMEILHLDPYVILYHDVISDAEIATLKNDAEHKLKRATINSKKHSYLVSHVRTVQSHIFMNLSNIIKRIDRRIADMTGFDLWDSEELQIMNYGMAGHYVTHWDYFNLTAARSNVKMSGNRVATVVFYLNDVEKGGATIFPEIQISVTPKKGAALLWYNLNTKGQVDPRTLHAACPVIVGSKWSAIEHNDGRFWIQCTQINLKNIVHPSTRKKDLFLLAFVIEVFELMGDPYHQHGWTCWIEKEWVLRVGKSQKIEEFKMIRGLLKPFYTYFNRQKKIWQPSVTRTWGKNASVEKQMEKN